MVFVDFHCHLDFEHFDSDRDDLVREMKEKNISAISNTTSFENYKYTKNLFKKAKNVLVTPGLYPQNAEKMSDDDFQDYLVYLRKNSDDFIGIGEIGLDKHHTDDEGLFEIQVRRFRALVELGIELNKVLIIHTRKAETQVIDILREYIEKTGFKKFNLHCFMGKKKFIKDIKELNLYCSIPLVLLNTQSFRILVDELPIRQLLVETDSPFLNPSKERNSPLNVPIIYEEIAKIKGLDKKEIENIIYRNYMKIIM